MVVVVLHCLLQFLGFLFSLLVYYFDAIRFLRSFAMYYYYFTISYLKMRMMTAWRPILLILLG